MDALRTFAALLLGLFAAPAWGAICDVRLIEPPEAIALTYDPFDLQTPTGSLRLAFENQSEARTLELILSGGDTPSITLLAGGTPIALDIKERSNVRPVSGALGDQFLVDAPPRLPVVALLDVEIAGAPVPGPGTYTGDIFVQLRDQATGEPCVERMRVGVQVQVPSRAQVNIAGASGSFARVPELSRIDFGTLETGEQARVFVQVRANGPSRIRVASQNGGLMRNLDDPRFTAPYAIDFMSGRLDLSGPVEIAAPPAQSIEGLSLPMVVQVGSVGGLPAGRYEDLVTISISAL